MRTRAERRHNDWHKAIRKRRIDRATSCDGRDWYDNLHQYSKNKITCSCGMCSRYTKTNNHGHRRRIPRNYAPSKNWSPSDKKRLDEMKQEMSEECAGGCTENNSTLAAPVG